MTKIVDMIAHSNNGSHWSVETMLETALAEVRAGNLPNKKAVLFLLEDSGDKYDMSTFTAGMRSNEIVALLEVRKSGFVEQMNETTNQY